MAFLIPIGIEAIEGVAGLFEAGEAVYAAAATDEAVALATEDAGAAENYAIHDDDVVEGEAALDNYENDYLPDVNSGNRYLRLPIEDPVNFGQEGYPDEGVSPYRADYWGDTTSPAYRLVRSTSSRIYDVLNAIRNDPVSRRTISIGAGKAVFVAGFWYFLDPITGTPIYAIGGEDPRLQQFMEALGYTNSAREHGLALRHWFTHLFENNGVDPMNAGPFTVRVPGAPRRPPKELNLISPSQGLIPSVTNFEEMPGRNPRKRPRTDSMMVPASAGLPRPMVMYRSVKPRPRSRIMTVSRALSKVSTIYIKNNSATGTLQFGGDLPNFAMSTADSTNFTDHGVKHADDSICYQFLLAAFNSSTDLTNAFDQYRLKSVVVTFIPFTNMSENSSVTTGKSIPTIYVVEDRDDCNTGAGWSDLATVSSKQGSKFFRFDQPYSIRLKPTPWTTSASADVAKTKVLGGWLPIPNNKVPHYGLKIKPVKETCALDYTYSMTVIIKGVFECKHMN